MLCMLLCRCGVHGEVASRAVLKDIHAQVRATLARIDVSLSEIRASEQRLADGTFRAQMAAETRAWFDALVYRSEIVD